VQPSQLAAGLASELKMKSYSTLKISSSLLRGASMLKSGYKSFLYQFCLSYASRDDIKNCSCWR